MFDRMYEERVSNEVNKTNLKYIGIFGIFDRYNTTLQLYP